MNQTEKQSALTNLVQLLYDNGGNRLTLSLINGISVTHGQFLDTLIVAEPVPEADNGPENPPKE